ARWGAGGGGGPPPDGRVGPEVRAGGTHRPEPPGMLHRLGPEHLELAEDHPLVAIPLGIEGLEVGAGADPEPVGGPAPAVAEAERWPVEAEHGPAEFEADPQRIGEEAGQAGDDLARVDADLGRAPIGAPEPIEPDPRCEPAD